MNKIENYIPTTEDYKIAENIMTDGQKLMTEWREVSKADKESKAIEAFIEVFGKQLDELEVYENEILVSNLVGKSSYLSYLAENNKLTLALGTLFCKDQSPEELIDDLADLISQRDELVALGYDVEINQADEIYELVFTVDAKPEELVDVLNNIKEFLPKELYPFVFKHPLPSDDCDACGRTFDKGQYVTGLVDKKNASGAPQTNRWAARICNCYRCAHEQPVAYRFSNPEEAEEFIKSGHFAHIENLKLGKKDFISNEILHFNDELPQDTKDNFDGLQRQRETKAKIFGGNTNK